MRDHLAASIFGVPRWRCDQFPCHVASFGEQCHLLSKVSCVGKRCLSRIWLKQSVKQCFLLFPTCDNKFISLLFEWRHIFTTKATWKHRLCSQRSLLVLSPLPSKDNWDRWQDCHHILQLQQYHHYKTQIQRGQEHPNRQLNVNA